MKTRIVCSLVLFILGLSGVRADDDSAALEKLSKIPSYSKKVPWDGSKLPTSVIVTSRGVIITNAKSLVPYNQVLEALAQLPKAAWPYGRAIAFYASPPGKSQREDQPAQAEAEGVEADLKRAGFSFLPVMSE
jgi:hypothetical protein